MRATMGLGRRADEKERREKALRDADRASFQAVDWHDFVVVEVIDFPKDELALPAQGQSVEEPGAPGMQGTAVPPPPPPCRQLRIFKWSKTTCRASRPVASRRRGR